MPDAKHSFSPEEIRNAEKQWKTCRIFLETMMSQEDVKNWIDPIEARGYSPEERLFTLGVPSEQFAMVLEDKYSDAFNLMLRAYFPADTVLAFEYQVQMQAPKVEDTMGQDGGTLRAENYRDQLNQAFSFDTFLESESNHFARTIGESVVLRPGQAPLNLLFIYGPSGVGKTHLVQAIGGKICQLHPELTVCYVSSGKFERQYVTDSMHNKNKNSFIRFYQQMDVLIIDDIQGLIGKQATQQAFFDIFNHLTQLGKQIILTCDVSPGNLGGMEDRILTRIQSSMMIPLERPDLELRRKILKARIAQSGVQLSEEVMEHIAGYMQNNVRELEGVIKTLLVHAQFQKTPISISEARRVMSFSISMTQREITMEDIQELVAEVYNVKVSELLSSTRKADIVLPRQIVMYLTEKHTKHSLSAIAGRLKRKNHTTVMHGIKTINNKLQMDEAFRSSVEELEQRLLAG